MLPHQALMLKPNPQCNGIWREASGRWVLGHGGGRGGGRALMDEISDLLRQVQRASAPSTPWAEGKNRVLNQPGRELPPDPESVGALILETPASKLSEISIYCLSHWLQSCLEGLRQMITVTVIPSSFYISTHTDLSLLQNKFNLRCEFFKV